VTRTKSYTYPPRRSYLFVGAGPWEVRLRDKQGKRFTWRGGLSWNQAQQAMRNARRANYRDPIKVRKGVK
jgi:hypothetical protein